MRCYLAQVKNPEIRSCEECYAKAVCEIHQTTRRCMTRKRPRNYSLRRAGKEAEA